MPSVTTCPACQGPLLVLSIDDADVRLRCPHCAAEFAVAQIVHACVDAPPLAQVIGIGALAEVGGPPPLHDDFDATMAWGANADEDDPGPTTAAATIFEMPGEVAEPLSDFPPDDFAPEELAPEPPPPALEAEPALLGTVRVDGLSMDALYDLSVCQSQGAGSAPVAAVGETLDPFAAAFAGASDDEREIGFQDEYEAPGDTFEASGFEDDAGASAGGVATIQAAPRRRKKQGGPLELLVMMGGMVLFGAVGLGLGYILLMWIGGREKDFMGIWDKLPSWSKPADGKGWMSEAPPAPPPTPLGGDVRMTGDAGQAYLAEIKGASATVPRTTLASHVVPVEEPNPVEATPQNKPMLGPRRYTLANDAELKTVLDAARRSLGCPKCNSTGFVVEAVGKDGPSQLDRRVRCEQCEGRPSGKMTPEVYDGLCALAKVATFVRLSGSEADAAESRAEVERVLAQAAGEQARAQIIGRLAGEHLLAADRGGEGVLLAGTVQAVGYEGSLYRTRLVLFGAPRAVNIYSLRPAQPELRSHDRVVIAGSIVTKPVDDLAGYTGGVETVVWGGLASKISGP